MMKKRKQNWNFNISEAINIRPSLYNVILLNQTQLNKITFISIINKFFSFKEKEHEKLYEKLTSSGELIIGNYTKDVAETKAAELNIFAKENYFNFSFFTKKHCL